MQYIQKNFQYTYEVKQSKFIAYFVPINLFESTLLELRSQHPKARHFVTAQRYLNAYEQIVEHSSDDGEPKGTSGKPSLIVLQGHNIINAAVIVVRYFGGTKLGTGGLVRAYSEAVNGVITESELLTYKKEIVRNVVVDYTDVRFIEYICEKYEISVVEKFFEEKVLYKLQGDEENMTLFISEVERVIRTLKEE
ncbi:MAG: YigZ family protein [Campylobacterales bacterium]|nr:YigZ family protein [Campylobacterales bacterium]